MKIYQRAVDIYKSEGIRGLFNGTKRNFRANIRKIKKYIRSISAKRRSDNCIDYTISGEKVTVPMDKPWQRDRFGLIHNERDLLEDIMSELRHDDVVYDIGAYLGWHSLAAGSMAQEGHVIAFEPHPISYERLSKVISQSPLKNIQIHNVGLSDSNSSVRISRYPESSARIRTKGQNNKETIKTNVVIGDEFVSDNQLRFPNLVKIDVEGNELSTIKGLTNTIKNEECRVIYCELHPDTAAEGQNIRKKITFELKKAGFNIERTLGENDKSIIKARKGSSS